MRASPVSGQLANLAWALTSADHVAPALFDGLIVQALTRPNAGPDPPADPKRTPPSWPNPDWRNAQAHLRLAPETPAAHRLNAQDSPRRASTAYP